MQEKKTQQIQQILKSAKVPFYLAPMFQVNDLAFRKMCRRHGILLCWTGMVNSHMWIINQKDRKTFFETCEGDRPLIGQINGNDENELLTCAQDLESFVDAIDINLGCTQHIARRGQYGYFMVNTEEKRQNVITLVENLTNKLSIPVTAKIRLLSDKDGNPDIQLTTEFAQRLEKAGISLISVHGRHKKMNKSGDADASAIKSIVDAVSIPVVANGGVTAKIDGENLVKETGAVGVMIGQALLVNPSLLETDNPDPVALTREYFELYKEHPIDFLIAKRHVFNFFEQIIKAKPKIAEELKKVHTPEEMEVFLVNYESGKFDQIEEEQDETSKITTEEETQ
ncbi:hypothetical protein TRFO_22269 [Tritrichomonas foetus]|uniref:DUS-like FMN-binding domain-containing protein n=1 Tax=Tritrichomonas foetus TaxID=1144522 RepID=A0A1J4KDF9_9EUKA|nr:hypothetical protein TRFO_22269 [Tritrichomonas foetus]|eukprot:OHT09018.1 hypothetical protein TRFO_22269 [Tritrichomonas foetus]